MTDSLRRTLASPAARCALGALLLTTCLPAAALRLGEARVLSRMSEPLVVEVEATLDPEERPAVERARLAAEWVFREMELAYPEVLRGARVLLLSRDGKHVLRVESLRRFDEPLVHLVLDVPMPSGMLRRRYDLLVEPPSGEQVSGATAHPTR